MGFSHNCPWYGFEIPKFFRGGEQTIVTRECESRFYPPYYSFFLENRKRGENQGVEFYY